MSALLIGLGGVIGAPLRFLIARRLDAALPWGTFTVNLAGSFLLGLLTALSVSGDVLLLLGTGLCGAVTTWSGLAVQSAGLGPRRGLLYVSLTIAGSLAVCASGFWLGQA